MIKKIEIFLEVLHDNLTHKIDEFNDKILINERKDFEIIMTKKFLCKKNSKKLQFTRILNDSVLFFIIKMPQTF